MMETNNSKEIKYYVVTEFFCSVICHIRTEYVFSLIAGKYESEKSPDTSQTLQSTKSRICLYFFFYWIIGDTLDQFHAVTIRIIFRVLTYS